MAGRLVVFEGPDGVGKSTLVRLVAAHLSNRGDSVYSMSFPGDQEGSLGKLVYELHHASSSTNVKDISALALQAMHVAAHLDSIERVIRPRLEDGTTVLLDRYWWSTWVYGRTESCNLRVLDALIEAERLSWGETRPNPAVLILSDIPKKTVLNLTEWRQLGSLYEELAAREKALHPVIAIDNRGKVEDTLSSLISAIDAHQHA